MMAVRSYAQQCRACDRRWTLFTVDHADVVCPYCGSRDVEAHETEEWPPRPR